MSVAQKFCTWAWGLTKCLGCSIGLKYYIMSISLGHYKSLKRAIFKKSKIGHNIIYFTVSLIYMFRFCTFIFVLVQI